eukprot:4715844-Prymnesium_polylepis.1
MRPVWGLASRIMHMGSRGATVLLPQVWSLATLLLTLLFPSPNWSSRMAASRSTRALSRAPKGLRLP